MGGSDEVILDQVEKFGTAWLEDAWKYIQEDRAWHYQMLMNIAPLARTPQSKGGATALTNYQRKLDRLIENMTPWRRTASGRLGNLHGKVKPGETVVLLDAGESSKDPLYAGAKVKRG